MSDETWVTQAGAWVGLVGGIAGLAALGRTELRSWRRRKVAPESLWELLPGIHRDFGTIIALGGRDSSWFLDEDRQRSRAMLDAVATQIVDDELNALVGDVRSSYHEAWAWCSAPGGARDSQRVQKQTDAARQGQSGASAAISRMGSLYRAGA